MTLRKRRVFALLFIFIFFISIPVLIMMTAGIFYDPTKNSFVQTGLLVISSQPQSASVMLNDKTPVRGIDFFLPWKPTTYKTPKRINYLFPGEYSLTLKKEGYLPYEQTIVVEGGRAAFVENIILIPDAHPLPRTQSQYLTVSPDGQFMLSLDPANQIVITNLVSEKRSTVSIPTRGIKQVHWLIRPYIFIEYEHSATIINYDDATQKLVDEFSESSFMSLDTSDLSYLYLSNPQTLFSIRVPTLEKQILATRSFVGTAGEPWWQVIDKTPISISGNTLFRGSRQYTPPKNLMIKAILGLIDRYIYIQSAKNEIYAIHVGTNEWVPIQGERPQHTLSIHEQDRNLLWWYGSFDIGFINTSTFTSTLITRVSSPIRSLVSYRAGNDAQLFFVSTDTSVLRLDPNSTNVRTTELFSSGTIIETALDQKEKILRIVSEEDGLYFLYEYPLELPSS